ncbi:hypothetical protein L1049_006559 [Liquidambar formosana]|uniref:NAC domain-containing protein n=1 Tax=Liquidambar formosana TaxID=63359 RepID=A0AAP0RFQ6_LIQFO
MDERSDTEKLDEILLPGFRFHPTDEELVGFYLKRKIQQRPLSIELIKQLDIYKHDPWDLPTQRALSHSWISPLPETITSEILTQGAHSAHFNSENMSSAAKPGPTAIQFFCNNDLQQQQTSTTNFSHLDFPSYKPINSMCGKHSQLPTSNGNQLPSHDFIFSPLDMSTTGPDKCTVDVSSMLLNMSSSMTLGDFGKASHESIDFGGSQEHCNGAFSITLPHEMQGRVSNEEETGLIKNSNLTHFDEYQWGTVRSIGFPFSLPLNLGDAWKSNLQWDSSPSPSDQMSTSFSTNKCYT